MVSNNKTLQTEERYYSRGLLFCKKIAKLKGIAQESVTADMLLNFFLENQHTYAKATFRQYKSSLLFFLQKQNLDPTGEVSAYLANLTAEACQNNTRKTSNLKRKQVTDEQFDGLLYALSCIPSYWQHLTISWLHFGALTGLRPSEWQNTELLLEQEKDSNSTHWVLRVKNGKNTNERSHGLYRHLHLADMSKENIEQLKEFIAQMKACIHSYGYEATYSGCKQFLNQVNNRLIKGKMRQFGFADCTGSGIYRRDKDPLRITLYSARHFFSSRSKTYMDRISVAAVMGHKNNVTAFEHYGRKHPEYSPRGKVKPDEREVKKVEVRNEKHDWLQRQKQQNNSVQNPTTTPERNTSIGMKR